jgi:DNA-binding PadR family transcriptional regulator
LDIIIIKALSTESLSGYGIISFVHREYGILIGSGRAYNLLHSMEKKGIISARKKGKAKYYILDKKGQETLYIIINNRNRMANTIKSIF